MPWERVHHLEGYSSGTSTGAFEGLPPKGDARSKAQLVETIAGDSSIAHGLAYASAIEALSASTPTRRSSAAAVGER